MPRHRPILALVVLLATATAIGQPAATPAAENPPRAIPAGVTCQLIGTYDIARLDRILTTERAAFCDYPVTFAPAKNPVRLYRLTYPSVIPEQGNRPTTASGLLAVPDLATPGPLPVLSYQHGTVFGKTEVPSRPDESPETRLILATFAAHGYLVIAADYFGKGDSPEPDSYLVKASTQQACLDLLRAAQAASASLSLEWGPLFLSGWSQGGWATGVFLQRLETLGIPVRAPTTLDAAFLPALLALLALQLHAYERYDDLPGLADAAIRPAYRATARDLYLNRIDWAAASRIFPAHVADLLDPAFAAAGSASTGRYWPILQESHAYRWRSLTPLRTYWGGSDEVVPESVASLPVAYRQTGSTPSRPNNPPTQPDARPSQANASPSRANEPP